VTEQQALLTAIAADPSDDVRRLGYADWLDEQPPEQITCPQCRGKKWVNRPIDVTRYELPSDFGPEGLPLRKHTCTACHGSGTVANPSNRDRAEFIRLQIEMEAIRRECWCGSCRKSGQHHNGPCGVDQRNDRNIVPRRRERELLDRHRTEWARLPCPGCGGSGRIKNAEFDTRPYVSARDAMISTRPFMLVESNCPTCGGTGDLFSDSTVTFSRGFIESVSCTLDEVVRPERICRTCESRGYRWDDRGSPITCHVCRGGAGGPLWATEWARAVARAAPVTKFVVMDAEAWRGESGAWYAVTPDMARRPTPRDFWDKINPDGGHPTREAATNALASALARWARAEVYEKAVWT
jgi:uncharacterized protein (TIGR02996 family)